MNPIEQYIGITALIIAAMVLILVFAWIDALTDRAFLWIERKLTRKR